MTDLGWSLLVEAIVLQAIKDYSKALKNHDKRMQIDCESFFKSQWFTLLCDLDGVSIQNLIKRRVKEKKKCISRAYYTNSPNG